MLFRLFSSQAPDGAVSLEGERIYLRAPQKADAAAWVALRRKCAPYQRALSPKSAFEDLDFRGYLSRLAGFRKDWAEDRAYVFSIFSIEDDRLLGGITLNNIVRGAGQMATLGYWLDEEERGKGFMPEAVELTCRFAFENLKLHRVQAGCLPGNAASRRVLEKSAFREEGIARQYIQIAGQWEDHVIYARVASDKTF